MDKVFFDPTPSGGMEQQEQQLTSNKVYERGNELHQPPEMEVEGNVEASLGQGGYDGVFTVQPQTNPTTSTPWESLKDYIAAMYQRFCRSVDNKDQMISFFFRDLTYRFGDRLYAVSKLYCVLLGCAWPVGLSMDNASLEAIQVTKLYGEDPRQSTYVQ